MKTFALLAKDPTTKNKWRPLTDACQVVLKGTPTGQHWLPIGQEGCTWIEQGKRMKTPCAIHRRDACAPCISETQRGF